ncbi:MAG: rod shape-determining protein MreC [Firmicutes bacterium]|nr:rod shape-determining protein MreC [Bacillota bacterium]
MHRLPLRKEIVILASIIVLCLGLARFTANFSGGPAADLLQEILAPLQSGVMRVWSGAGSLFDFLARARRLQEENSLLRQRVRELTWENNRLREYVYENRRLLRLLDFKERNARQFTLLGARVISRSPSTWYSTLVVDRGSTDGVRENQVVVSDAGLVGRVASVSSHTARVLLILDLEGAVGAMVQENRTVGVVEGSKDEPGLLRMVHLPYDVKLRKGQVVITSGLGGVFPPGIPIGEILRVEDEGSELDKYALVRPYVDFNRLEELFIITEIRSVPEPVLQEENAAGPRQTVHRSEGREDLRGET